MFDAWNGRLGWIKSMHSSVNQWTVTSYTSWVRLGFWESHPKRNHFELRWVTCPGMLARRAGWKFPVSTVVSFHFSTSVHHFDWFFSQDALLGLCRTAAWWFVEAAETGNWSHWPRLKSRLADSDDVLCGHAWGYDEQGIVRGVLDSCEVGWVKMSIDVTWAWLSYVISLYLHVKSCEGATGWQIMWPCDMLWPCLSFLCNEHEVFDPIKQRWSKTGSARTSDSNHGNFWNFTSLEPPEQPRQPVIYGQVLLRARWGHGSPGSFFQTQMWNSYKTLCIPLSWQAARSWDRKFTQPRPQMSQEPCLKFVALPCAMYCMLGLGNVLGRWLCAPSGFPDWRGQGVSWDRGIETANPSLFWIQELMETLRSCEAQSMTCMIHRTSSNRSWSIRVLHLEAYDLTTDQWRTAPSLNVARAGARLVMKEESKKARTQHEI